MILVDFSQILTAGCLVQPEEFKKGGDTKKMSQIARHVVLNSLLSYKTKYGEKYGDIVVCCDGRNYWRKEKFSYYKHHRKDDRKKSDTDWSTIHSVGSEIKTEIKENFPFKLLNVDRAEADDVVATLVKYTQDNELEVTGLEETPQKVLVISSDGDFKQLFKYRNYTQWNPIMNKLVTKPEKTFLLEKLLTGDTGDGIPNVRSRDDILLSDERQKSITAKFKSAFLENPDGSTLTEDEKRNFHRNRLLIDFDYIPEDISKSIIDEYKKTEVVISKSKVFEYLTANRLRLLTTNMDKFF